MADEPPTMDRELHEGLSAFIEMQRLHVVVGDRLARSAGAEFHPLQLLLIAVLQRSWDVCDGAKASAPAPSGLADGDLLAEPSAAARRLG